MSRALALFAAGVLLLGPSTTLRGQAVPEGSQASKVQLAYRRTPTFRNDPFRHVMIPHWGLVFSSGASVENNALEVADVRAFIFLADSTKNPGGLLPDDILSAIGLIPRGGGLSGILQGEGGVHLGGPLGGHLSIGLSARGRGYGSFQFDDTFLSLLRDGNGARQDFSLGNTKVAALATAEAGAHGVVRLGPWGSPDAVRVVLGVGGRYIRPVAYGDERSTVANGGLRVTGDSVVANIAIQQLVTRDPEQTFRQSKGSIANDFLVRLEWPTSGFALEAMVANIGNVTIPLVQRSNFRLNVATTKISVVQDSLDKNPLQAGFQFKPFTVQDTIALSLTLPRIVRFTASSWANRILQVDLSATLPVTGDFESPLAVDVGTTWRLIRTLPLRAGLVLGGSQGIGYTGGIAIEGRTMYLQVGGQSFGGFANKAKGAGVRFDLGLFF